MHLDYLLDPRQSSTDGCIACPSSPPPCNCNANEHCFQQARSCTACSSFQCVANGSSSVKGKGGIGTGAVAGAVVGALIFVAVGIALFVWWRRRNLARIPQPEPEVKDVPAPAETVLNRPNPTEKPPPTPTQPQAASVLRMYGNSSSVIDLDPESRGPFAQDSRPSSHRDSIQSNPFTDGQSIQTTSTGSQSTNVIPIALVPPGTVSPVSSHSPASRNGALPPVRPARSPDVGLNMDHMNFSSESNMGTSTHSGVSSRHSYLTEASFASDVLTEAPTIVTQSQRQVLGVVKAEVVHTPGSTPSTPSASASSSRFPGRSPLAASSFGPQDVLQEVDETQTLHLPGDPFIDDRSPGIRSSMATMGTSASDAPSSVWAAPLHPWSNAPSNPPQFERPASTYTQAASVIGADIMDATRVHLGFSQSASASIVPATPLSSSVSSATRGVYRMTSAKLVTPSTSGTMNTLERQQERALAEVRAAKNNDFDASSRMSMSTMASGMSARADSILESFTFVPPSPISNRPIRTPPRSPLTRETETNTQINTRAIRVDDPDSVLEPPDRRTLGLSSGSQLSSMSTGLGSFPFQIDHGNGHTDEPQASSPPPSSVLGRQRASLDTLALTSDLSSYPLGFDRPSRDEDFTAFQKSLRKL